MKSRRRRLRPSTRKRPRVHRRNPGRGGGVDSVAARELELFIVNDGELYRRQGRPIVLNLARKLAKGVYDKALAVKLWGYLAKSGADKYAKDFGGGSSRGADIFNKATRDVAAAGLAEYYMDEVKGAAKDVKVPKPRKPKTNPAPSEQSRYNRLTSAREKIIDRMERAKSEPKLYHFLARKLTKLERIKADAMARYRKPPRSFIKKVKPTMSHIREVVTASGSHFFDRESMKFFGQRISNFKVFRSKKSGRIFIGAPSPGLKGMFTLKRFTLREFDGNKLTIVENPPSHWEDVPAWVNSQ